jgi:hypothetical protein
LTGQAARESRGAELAGGVAEEVEAGAAEAGAVGCTELAVGRAKGAGLAGAVDVDEIALQEGPDGAVEALPRS